MAGKGIEMVEAISLRVTVEDFGLGHAGSDQASGDLFVISFLFFLTFALHADGLMIIYRQNPLFIASQAGMAA
jgi:hypothetical protein